MRLHLSRKRGCSSQNHILGIYLPTARWFHRDYTRGKDKGSANLNQCPVVVRATSLQFFSFNFFPPKIYQEFLPQETPGLISPQYQSQLSARHLAFFTSMSGFLNSSLRSWFTTWVVLLYSPTLFSAQTDKKKKRIYHTCNLSES